MTVTMTPLAEWTSKTRSAADHCIVNNICEALGYEAARVRGPSRYQEDVEARANVSKVLRGEFGWSFPRIGHALGGKHHTSIMFLCGAGKHVRKTAVDYGAVAQAGKNVAG